MATGYGGSYRAVVVNSTDPMQQNRLQVVVPDVYGDPAAWAAPANSTAAPPPVGETVWISFERGDTDFPVWSLDEGSGGAARGYVGKYRGVVVDNADPQDEHRLLVDVPDVDTSSVWATAEDRYMPVPDVGAAVWIEYDHGDPAYPRWVGPA